MLLETGEEQGRCGYPPEFRRRLLDLIEAGRTVADVARDLQISQQTIYVWRRQDRIDRGLEPGVSSIEKAELAEARRRVAQRVSPGAVIGRYPHDPLMTRQRRNRVTTGGTRWDNSRVFPLARGI